ncbi:hypothetical protein HTZ77_35320 [Nonomuraea sp. SMC257]|uniref:Uncharacterized protein n=1 Tax=Nonomuraea montanisoli TaxID=2741721 RepID=A0A7Y6IEG6_9ACTN|nr:hypothetical protein [Nonomuraea montanisoli]NUW36641.1 hypothetical protein [Nonomuraea montanisoli]
MTLTELLEKYGDKREFMPLYVGVAAWRRHRLTSVEHQAGGRCSVVGFDCADLDEKLARQPRVGEVLSA